jgi:hypothetical protein
VGRFLSSITRGCICTLCSSVLNHMEVREPYIFSEIYNTCIVVEPHLSLSSLGSLRHHSRKLLPLCQLDYLCVHPMHCVFVEMMWRRNKAPCQCSSFEARIIKDMVRTQRHELDIQEDKLTELETNFRSRIRGMTRRQQ